MPRLLLCLAPWTLAACGAGAAETTCSTEPVSEGCNSSLSQRGCASEGGCWGTWGLSDQASCNCQTSDVGQTCTTNADCDGVCVAAQAGCETAIQGTCSSLEQVYGCYCAPNGDGSWSTVCAD